MSRWNRFKGNTVDVLSLVAPLFGALTGTYQRPRYCLPRAPRISRPASFLRLHKLQALISHLTRVICSISRLLNSPRFAPRTSSAASPQTALAPIISTLPASPHHRIPIVLSFFTQPLSNPNLHAPSTCTQLPLHARSTALEPLPAPRTSSPLLCSLKSSSVIINHPSHTP